MGKTSIEWCDFTFNPWWGCVAVSSGCKNCYAQALDARYNANDKHWGPDSTRKEMSKAYWNAPFKWNRDAEGATERPRVFCASMADVFEDRDELLPSRAQLFEAIRQTPNLDWLLLTKRPENIARMLPTNWGEGYANVWLGTSVENQKAADKRIPELLKVPAVVRFLSCEPLLGSVNLRHMDVERAGDKDWCFIDCLTGRHTDMGRPCPPVPTINWVICGGESGPGARPMLPDWARSLRDQCQSAGVAYHFKQWGEYVPRIVNPPSKSTGVLEFPDKEIMTRVGKKNAGRLLDGRAWDEFPAPRLDGHGELCDARR